MATYRWWQALTTGPFSWQCDILWQFYKAMQLPLITVPILRYSIWTIINNTMHGVLDCMARSSEILAWPMDPSSMHEGGSHLIWPIQGLYLLDISGWGRCIDFLPNSRGRGCAVPVSGRVGCALLPCAVPGWWGEYIWVIKQFVLINTFGLWVWCIMLYLSAEHWYFCTCPCWHGCRMHADVWNKYYCKFPNILVNRYLLSCVVNEA